MMNKLYFYCLALFVAPTFSAFGQTQPSQDENGIKRKTKNQG